MGAAAVVLWLRLYAGPDGQLVEIAKLSPTAALVRVTKSGSPHDGLVLRCETDERSGRFTTRYHGGDWTVVALNGNGAGEAFVPEANKFRLKYIEAEHADPSVLLAEHAKQQQNGRLALFAKKDYPHLVKKYEAKAAAACPGVAFSYDWASFTDDDMANVDVAALCVPSSCPAAVTQMVCRRGSKKLQVREGARLTFEVVP